MSLKGSYTFLPWLRRGLGNQITTPDGDPSVKVRPRITVALVAHGEPVGAAVPDAPVNKPMQIYGPGDIIGVERRAVVRTDPHEEISNFAPNHLAHVDFYEEDFPWRYTPAAPDLSRGRLRPWLALIVLAEDEFADGRDGPPRPSPWITVKNPSALPPPGELWAWAHVHVNRDIAASATEIASADGAGAADRLTATVTDNPDLAYARLVCPRRLKENTKYHAFVVPTFEAGRRAGLKLPLGDVRATLSAWGEGADSDHPEPASLPVYHRWSFHTGDNGDFETLVRLLRPRKVDPRVGTREMDLLDPGSGVPEVDNPDLHGILKLGGALRPPTPVPAPPADVYEKWDAPFPRPLQTKLAALLNLPDDYAHAGAADPVIAPPLYGRWHAMTSRADATTDTGSWVQRLNLDPRFRVPAGFGTRVVQDQQERYVDAAWDQLGDVLKAQRRIRFGQLGVLISDRWHKRHLATALASGPQRVLALLAPVSRRVLSDGVTLRHAQSSALVQPVMTSAPLRRVLRSRARLGRALLPPGGMRTLIGRINAGEVSAAPPVVAPPGVPTAGEAAQRVAATVPAGMAGLLGRFPSLPLWVLLAALVLVVVCAGPLALLFLPAGALLAVVLIAAGVLAYRTLRRWARIVLAAWSVNHQTPASIDRIPGAGGFRITQPGDFSGAAHGGTDSTEASKFRDALRDAFALHEAGAAAGVAPLLRPLDLDRLAATALGAVHPLTTIPRRINTEVFLPLRISGELTARPPAGGFVEPMAYPVIDEPMYEPLSKLGSELFLPNVNLIEPNTITLLETNQRFIESYMTGVNHEFARELLWREYPTDQRGTPFRQFWDVRGVANTAHLAPEAFKERMRDIPPLHTWALSTPLGKHDNHESPGAQVENVVLVIRGELLKRYPRTVIYAHRAEWEHRAGDVIDNSKPRRLADVDPDVEQPPHDFVRTWLYSATIAPDITIFGFDLEVPEAKGDSGEHPGDNPGWFFVLKERPGEPAFGLDTESPSTLQTWNDLSWSSVGTAKGDHLRIATAPGGFPLAAPPSTAPARVQHDDDVHVQWSHDMHSGTLAYILFQAPVLVAVHASEMLPR